MDTRRMSKLYLGVRGGLERLLGLGDWEIAGAQGGVQCVDRWERRKQRSKCGFEAWL